MAFDWKGFDAGHPKLERGDLRTNDFIELHGDALLDLHERLGALESIKVTRPWPLSDTDLRHTAREAMSAAGRALDAEEDLQARVNMFMDWICSMMAAGVPLHPSEINAKLEEFGLTRTG